jgi:uncharacterized protein DUF4007
MNEDSPSPGTKAGHRERMRARLLAGDESALTDEALLELLLTYSIPRRDVRPLAETLLAKFGSAVAVLAAEPSELEKVSGIKESSVVLMKLAHRLASVAEPVSVENAPLPEQADKTESFASAPEPPAVPCEETAARTSPSRVAEEDPKPVKRTDAPKLQVSNGYSLDLAQNARLLSYIAEHPAVRRFARRDVMEGTGLAEGQVESLTSVGVAMGLVAPVTAVLTPFGRLVHQHDLFFDSPTTLEFCHFLGAGNPRNLIWHSIFNELLVEDQPMDQAGWSAWLREKLAGSYSKRSLVKHVASEVRFVLDAYTVKNFKKLNLLVETLDNTIALRRYTALQPLTLAAMIYWVGEEHQARLVSFSELQAEPGSPGRVFGLDPSSMRQMVEVLHQKGWIRYEVRHGLDQIRLTDGFQPLEFLAAAYENREPEIKTKPNEPGPERLLL